MPIRKILVPTDFSAAADEALAQALELAKAFGAQLTLFHAYEPIIPAQLETGAYFTPQARDAIGAPARDRLAAAKADALARWRVPDDALKTRFVLGAPSLRICEEAQRGGYDLIVMGTRGRTGMKRVLMGSVAEHVLACACCPVLIVRDAGSGSRGAGSRLDQHP
jgi:nucleotide-binding universal stress UspA family protein